MTSWNLFFLFCKGGRVDDGRVGNTKSKGEIDF